MHKRAGQQRQPVAKKPESKPVRPEAKTGMPWSAPVLAERLGDGRFAAAQRQTIAAKTGPLVGNHAFSRLLGSQTKQNLFPIQRNVGLVGAMVLSNVLATKAAVQPTIAEHESLKALDEAIDALGAESRKKSYFHEEIGSGRDELVTGLEELRGRVAETVIADKLSLNEGLANAIRQHFYLKLSRLAPYYTQVANANILAIKSTEASMRTCNITTVAMTLEGLGKTASDFQGNSSLMNQIASRLSLGTRDASSLRLPDFLQILAIYLAMVQKQNASSLNALATSNPEQFQTVMVEGAKKAANDILISDLFNTFTRQFGVSARSQTLDLSPALAVFGEYYRPFEGDLANYVRKKKNKGPKAKVTDAEKDAFRDEFTAKRKRRFRGDADRIGQKITKSGEALQKIEADITATQATLLEYEEKLKTLAAAKQTVEAQLAELTGDEADPKQVATLKASQKAQDKEQKAAAKKQKKLQNDLTKLEDKKIAQLTSQAKLQLAQGANEAVGSETNEAAEVEDALPLATYQNAVLPLMLELLGLGKQVIVNLYNHFVKLQDISTEAITVHDPGGYTRDNRVVSWDEARQMGYFKRYTIVG